VRKREKRKKGGCNRRPKRTEGAAGDGGVEVQRRKKSGEGAKRWTLSLSTSTTSGQRV